MKKYLSIILLFAFLLSGCHVISEDQLFSSKSAAPKIVPGVTQVTGVLVDLNNAPLKEVAVHFAQVYRDKGKAAFLYDAGESPSAMTDKAGAFSIVDLPAGEYVVIVGDPMTKYTVLSDDAGETRVVIAQGGESLSLETLVIAQ